MTTKRISIKEATLDELRQFATINLGMDVPEKVNVAKLLADIQAIYQGDTIALVATAPGAGRVLDTRPRRTRIREGTEHFPPPPERPEDFDIHAQYQVTEVCIQVEPSERPGGKDPVEVAVNGAKMFIERGKPQWVREHYIEVLDHAIEWEYPENKNLGPNDLGGLDESKRREVRCFPFSFV